MGFLPGLRWRKSVSVLPGVKVNLSKGGVSASVGGKGATVNVGTRTQTVNLGIPGTGLSYRMPLGTSLIWLIIAAVVVLGIAWLVAPGWVRMVLHLWQPKLF
jgi:hypothetical protein